MIRTFVSGLSAALLLASTLASANETATVINDKQAAKKLLGEHGLTLQWVSWEPKDAGLATVENRNGVYYLNGRQDSNENSDFVKVDGVITRVDAKQFTFKGKIITQYADTENKPCTRDGEFTFLIKGGRQFWRLQQMDNPCDPDSYPTTDYVDLRFKKP